MMRNQVVAALAVALGIGWAHVALGAVFNDPTPYLTGNTPSGIPWATVATGTSLPIRSSTTTYAGKPGAVAYYNVKTGQLSIDPKGWNIALINFTYTSGNVNINSSTVGPLRYASGTSPSSAVVSGVTGVGNQRTLPAGTWTLITAFQARIAATVSVVRAPTLATVYDAGNGAASGTSPYSTNPAGEAVTAGWFTQPWTFPADLVDAASVATINITYWKVFGVTGHLNANILGHGNYQGVFQYTVDGVAGSQVGPVIPYSIREPTTTVLTVSPTPSKEGIAVTLEATVSSASASGTVTFKDGATVLGTGTLSSGVATLATAALNVGVHSLTAEYGGDSSYLASISAIVSHTVQPSNASPVASNPSVTRSTRGLRVALTTLATDAESDPLVFAGLTSAIGATVQVSGGYLVYLAPSEGDTRGDTVAYSVSDGHSSGAGTLTISFAGPAGAQSAGVTVVGGSVTVRFAGIPGLSYRVQRADDVGFASNLSVSAPFVMPASGIYWHTDPAPPGASAYYRLLAP